MGQPPNYPAAARRHKRDADILFGPPNRRLNNADHLYGFAAECALLGSLCILHRAGVYVGLSLAEDGSILDADLRRAGHIRELWSHMIGRLGRVADRAIVERFSPFTSHRDGGIQNPFRDWSVNDRYADDGCASEQRVIAHQKGADACLSVLKQVEQHFLKRPKKPEAAR